MTPEEFLATAESSVEPSLERLSSMIDDASDRQSEAFLRSVAGTKAAARDRFAAWAEAAVDDVLHDAYLDAAEREAEHYERVLAELPEETVEPLEGPFDDHLADVRNPAERIAAGFVGRALVETRVEAQLQALFARRGEERRAAIFRDLRTETGRDVERGATLLAKFCRMDDDWERALDAATETVSIAVEDRLALGEPDAESP